MSITQLTHHSWSAVFRGAALLTPRVPRALQMRGGYSVHNDAPLAETETCVSCGCDTGVPRTQDIRERRGYTDGVGQCCDDCAI